MWVEASITDSVTKDLMATVITNLYVRGAGGFGHKGHMKSKIPKALPKREPDFVTEEKTTPN